MPALKIRLRNGSREIEIEGSREDVDNLLAAWWSGSTDTTDDNDAVIPKKKARSHPTSGRAQDSPASAARGDEESLAAHSIANSVKSHEDFDLFEKKLLHVSGDLTHKVAFICWLVNEPLTSGQIYRALKELSIKCDLPRVSRTLKREMNKFIVTGQRKAGGGAAKYSLSAVARAEFEKWLSSTEEKTK